MPTEQTLFGVDELLNVMDIVITSILTLVGLVLANNVRRQTQLQVAEKRLAAYEALWEKMLIATPTRLASWNYSPLSREERVQLFKDITEWYYQKGNGLFLGDNTRNLYLIVKDNLICPIAEFQPKAARERLQSMVANKQEPARGEISIRQLSLLRSRMKADLSVFGPPYHTRLEAEEIALLEQIGEDLNKRPWKTSLKNQAERQQPA